MIIANRFGKKITVKESELIDGDLIFENGSYYEMQTFVFAAKPKQIFDGIEISAQPEGKTLLKVLVLA